jgi:hypothetical protein
MAISLSKILSISFRDYAESQGKSLFCFEPIGVHAENSVKEFAKQVPDNAEVVVDYHLIPYNSIAYGTALIRR